MQIIIWIIFGGLVGWISSYIMKTRRRGIIKNVIVGLIGSLIGGFLGSLLGIGSVSTFTIEGFLLAIGGSILFIAFLKGF